MSNKKEFSETDKVLGFENNFNGEYNYIRIVPEKDFLKIELTSTEIKKAWKNRYDNEDYDGSDYVIPFDGSTIEWEDILEDVLANSELEALTAEELGALTSNTYLYGIVDRDDDDYEISGVHVLYYYDQEYRFSPLQRLCEYGYVLLKRMRANN